ncbi:MAG: alpha-galactosidase [Candidatus Bathyarchaeia archaeon]
MFPLVWSLADSVEVKTWVMRIFAQNTIPPFSFTYAGKPSSYFIHSWDFASEQKQIDDERSLCLFTWGDPQTNLELKCECTLFSDFPAVEWVLRFNFLKGAANKSPLIEDIQTLDLKFISQSSKGFILHRSLGSSAQRNDFAPIHEEIKQNTTLSFAPIGGRSSNTTASPFFNLEATDEGGVIIAIGWSGQWSSLFTHEGDGVKVQAGMELTRLSLYSGEEIRTPRVLLLFWRGNDFLIGQNMFRRFILKHRSPKQDGKSVMLPLSCSSCGPPDEANQATEQNQINFASQFVRYGVEYFWLDAGWFEGRWPNGVGNWFPRKDGFPNGLRPISDAVKRMGMKGMILWFEPERVFQGTWIDREHPDWVLRLPDNPNGLLNLGNESARKWLTEHISAMIESEGISIYRHDFNIDPLPFWRAADPPDRQGITEIRYIEGLYEFWDELLRRHPGLLIDNCASGGRRIDLETISRSIVLWRSDYQYFEPVGQQCHTYGISLWLPTTATGCGYPKAYLLRSAANSGVNLWVPWSPNASHEIYSRYLPRYVDWRADKPIDVDFAKALIEEFKEICRFFFGDFYPLTPYSTADDAWMTYQFHDPDLSAGVVLAFRRSECGYPSIYLKLRGLSETTRYLIEIVDEQLNRKTCQATGKQLTDGIEISSEAAPSSTLIIYRPAPTY